MTPIRGTEQPLRAIGWNRMIPGLAGLTETLTIPRAFVRPETFKTPAPLTRTRAPFAGFPSVRTFNVNVCRFPAVNECGDTATA